MASTTCLKQDLSIDNTLDPSQFSLDSPYKEYFRKLHHKKISPNKYFCKVLGIFSKQYFRIIVLGILSLKFSLRSKISVFFMDCCPFLYFDTITKKIFFAILFQFQDPSPYLKMQEDYAVLKLPHPNKHTRTPTVLKKIQLLKFCTISKKVEQLI